MALHAGAAWMAVHWQPAEELPTPTPAAMVAMPLPPKPKPDTKPPASATTAPPEIQARPASAVAALAPGSAAAPSANAVPTWQGLLLSQLERFKRYPGLAQRRHQQGVAYLRFTMDRHGKVLAARIDKSSGVETLDDEALIHRAEPLPPPPPEVPGDPIELVIPVQFFLK